MKASNCHLLWTEDSQGLRLNFIQSVMACLNFQNTYFRQHHQNYWWLLLYVLEALVFRNTSKWMLSSLSNQIIFFSEYFYFKNHPKKRIPSFSCIHHYFLCRHSSKTFLYWRNITYLHKRLIWVYIRITNTKTITKTKIRIT